MGQGSKHSGKRHLLDRWKTACGGFGNAISTLRTREDKLQLREQDNALRADLAHELEILGFGHDNARAIANWDPYNQNAHAAWFDREWMFGLSDGFDIVIGNPPYIRGEKIPDKVRLRDKFGDFYKGAADVYTYFYQDGVWGSCERTDYSASLLRISSCVRTMASRCGPF